MKNICISCVVGLIILATCCCSEEGGIETPSVSWIDEATPANVLPANGLIGDDWQLAFSDEFNDGAVNFNKWTILDQHRGAVAKHGINNWYFKLENVSESDGNLILKNTKVGNDVMYCASINSNKKYFMKYGYTEARVKIADTNAGALTAFWLQSNTMGNIDGTGNDGAEIDIFESAYVTDEVITTIHIDGYAAPDHQEKNYRYVTPGLFDGYHIWGCLWDENSVKIYYDGKLTAEYDGIWVPQVEEFLYLSTVATFGETAYFKERQPDSWLSEACFDYVRVWTKGKK